MTNTQRLGTLLGGRAGPGIVAGPQDATPPPSWFIFIGIQGDRRVMQFGFRYQF